MTEDFAERRWTIGVAVVLFSILFAAAIRRSNGWLDLVPTAVGPLVATAFFSHRPFNPYRSLWGKLEGMEDRDRQDDSHARRLVALFGSHGAKGVLLRTGLWSSIALFGIGVAIVSLIPGPLN